MPRRLQPARRRRQQRRVMQRHTVEGARILSGSTAPLTRMAEVIALAHHERWDGAGYPHGLAGEAIPLVALIVAVADVVDALAHDRPYRGAWARARVVAHVRDSSGTHFATDVVAAFLGLDFLPGSAERVAAPPATPDAGATRDARRPARPLGDPRGREGRRPASRAPATAAGTDRRRRGAAREYGRRAYAAGTRVDALADVLSRLALPDAYRAHTQPEAIIDAAPDAYLEEEAGASPRAGP
ncbi:MAG: HD-GYP domain-containing protein [Longimicrobiales bacterium]